jgi:cytochrome c
MLAHPFLPPQLVGRPLINATDGNGKQYIKEMIDVANTDGQGWVRYLSRRRGYREEQLKETYVMRIPDMDVIVAAGYFPPDGQ